MQPKLAPFRCAGLSSTHTPSIGLGTSSPRSTNRHPCLARPRHRLWRVLLTHRTVHRAVPLIKSQNKSSKIAHQKFPRRCFGKNHNTSCDWCAVRLCAKLTENSTPQQLNIAWGRTATQSRGPFVANRAAQRTRRVPFFPRPPIDGACDRRETFARGCAFERALCERVAPWA
ncbi:unnamed protein product [Chondrus crispus]|uniref:Uncharacterized protein n=1 Tax=Chondrus crispus TaxID=2769 RepID=R7QMX5_CHOCR|nr:unnamed protein product [Chondrus crispus]CDF39439.1 unnamed protein product [Chondrus crispus]|eukprot:XP_005719350.1 unnamed protein product [Chondrus crispus]